MYLYHAICWSLNFLWILFCPSKNDTVFTLLLHRKCSYFLYTLLLALKMLLLFSSPVSVVQLPHTRVHWLTLQFTPWPVSLPQLLWRPEVQDCPVDLNTWVVPLFVCNLMLPQCESYVQHTVIFIMVFLSLEEFIVRFHPGYKTTCSN